MNMQINEVKGLQTNKRCKHSFQSCFYLIFRKRDKGEYLYNRVNIYASLYLCDRAIWFVQLTFLIVENVLILRYKNTMPAVSRWSSETTINLFKRSSSIFCVLAIIKIFSIALIVLWWIRIHFKVPWYKFLSI